MLLILLQGLSCLKRIGLQKAKLLVFFLVILNWGVDLDLLY